MDKPKVLAVAVRVDVRATTTRGRRQCSLTDIASQACSFAA